jgi:subtilase family serine protease
VQGLDSEELQSSIESGANLVPAASPSASSLPYRPSQIATAYDYPSLHGFDGTGKTIAVATSGDFNDSDLQTFDAQFGINLAGYSRIYMQGNAKKAGLETTLDMEWSTALANGAYVLVYINSNAQDASFTVQYNQIVIDNKADVVTSSWGLSEQEENPSVMAQDDGIFEQGAVQGQTWFIASGDNGAFDDSKSSDPSVDYPASSPYVTATGGTSLTLSSSGTIASETAWSGSGGGSSIFEPQPSWELGSSYFSNRKRWLPDMAMDGDPNTGMFFFWKNFWYYVGGTSIVAPFSSALASEIAQYDNSRLGIFAARLNQLANSNPRKYGRVLHDITQGNNGYYNAGPEWGPVTGWGSPDGYELMLNY